MVFEQTYEHTDTEGGFIWVKGTLNGTDLTLFNVYAPPWSEFGFFKTIIHGILNQTGRILTCGGDGNIHLSQTLTSQIKNIEPRKEEKHLVK